MIGSLVQKDFQKVLEKLRIRQKAVFEHPLRQAQGKLDFGDYSTNIALRVKKPEFASPFDLANKIVNTWRSMGLPDWLAKIAVAPPGFINLWLKDEVFISQLSQVLKQKDGFGKLTILKGKKILLEHTSPNPQTTIMLGHLRNNFLGMAMSNILEFSGSRVTKDCIVNDRGVHICKAIWGYLVFAHKKSGVKKNKILNFQEITDEQIEKVSAKVSWRKLLEVWSKKKNSWLSPSDLKLKPDHANLIWYVLGSRSGNLLEEAKSQVEEILLAWEKEEKSVWQIWRQILAWSDTGYQETYKRVGSIHDWVWYESDHYKMGKEIVEEGLKKKVFRISEGAVVTDFTKFGLPDTVVQKADGTALYITQDLALTGLKVKKFPSDLYIWDIGEEQTLYFKQLFAVCEQLGIGKRDKFFHLSYALINFKGGGKMATRRGDVIMADETLDELHRRAMEIIKSSNPKLRGKLSLKQLDDLAEAVALSAIKYSLLKFSRETTIYFDIDESLSLEGNSGPYLQYTYARTQSVFRKAGINQKTKKQKNRKTVSQFLSFSVSQLQPEELIILRTLYKFPEVVQSAAESFSPNLLANFLFDLAQKYNLFYNRLPILHPEKEPVSSFAYNRLPILKSAKGIREFRLALTAAVAQVLKNGLSLLGIKTLERM